MENTIIGVLAAFDIALCVTLAAVATLAVRARKESRLAGLELAEHRLAEKQRRAHLKRIAPSGARAANAKRKGVKRAAK